MILAFAGWGPTVHTHCGIYGVFLPGKAGPSSTPREFSKMWNRTPRSILTTVNTKQAPNMFSWFSLFTDTRFSFWHSFLLFDANCPHFPA